MRVTIKLTQGFADLVEEALAQPHPFAHERLGFLLARWAFARNELLIFPFEYLSVPDGDYVKDPTKAVINSAAIRMALQATLTSGAACFYVHAHPPGLRRFSQVDLDSQHELMPSFVAINRAAPHGALLFAGSYMCARVWLPDDGGVVEADRVTVVGYPLRSSSGRAS